MKSIEEVLKDAKLPTTLIPYKVWEGLMPEKKIEDPWSVS